MKLVLPIPSDWRRNTLEEGEIFEAPVRVFGMLVMPFAPAHEDAEAWMRQAFVVREHEGRAPDNLRSSLLITDDGWAAMLLDGTLGSEARLVAYFRFLDYAATVVVACRAPALAPLWRGDALDLLAKARPDFRQAGVACLAELLGSPPPVEPTPPSELTIPLPAWRRSFSGGDALLTSTAGPGVGRVRISERITPLRPVREIFAPLVAAGERGAKVEGPTLMTTAEGEYAAIATVQEPERQQTVGVVFGDQHYTRIDGVTHAPAQFPRYRSAVHKLTYAATLGLGYTRWRPYYYEPPPGWIGVARTHGTVWLAPSSAQRLQLMKVYDARPPAENQSARLGALLFETLPPELFLEPAIGPIEFYTPSGLKCRLTVHTGRIPNHQTPIKALEGLVIHERYLYPLRMECDAEVYEETMHIFERVVGSIRLIVERGADIDPDRRVLDNFAD